MAADAATEAGAGSEEEVSLIGRGLTSCAQVSELRQFAASLTSVCLHGNNITSLEGISQLTRLQHLNLSSNALASLDGLQGECCWTHTHTLHCREEYSCKRNAPHLAPWAADPAAELTQSLWEKDTSRHTVS